MYSSHLKSLKASTFMSHSPFMSIPIKSISKNQKKYQTPYKSHNTNATITRNATFSLYSFTSKKKSSKPNNKNKNGNYSTWVGEKSKSKNKVKLNNPMISRSKSTKQRGTSKKQKKGIKQKEISTSIKQQTSISNVMNNTSFYRSTRASIDSQSNLQLMGKISKIFDLVTLKIQVPVWIQSFLKVPLYNLRYSLRQNSRYQIAKNLIKFKNQCSEIFQRASSSQICQFIRSDLPQENRWTSKTQSFTKQQNERHIRQKYFQSLRKKSEVEYGGQDRRLANIENRLNQFWQKSMNSRKVFI